MGVDPRAECGCGVALGLEIYGGNPEVVASYEELQRISGQLTLAAERLEEAMFEPQHLLFDLLPNPLPQIQLMFLLPGLIERVRTLASKTHLAAEAYFSTEARILLLMQQTLQPLERLSPIISSPNPISQGSAEVITKAAAAFAVLGLTGAPSLGKTVMVSTATALLPLAAGYRSTPHMIQGIQQSQLSLGFGRDLDGSAKLVKLSQSQSGQSIAEHASRLRSAYGSGSKISIEVYPLGYGRQINVYVPGTQTFSFEGSNPLNIRSGLTALGGSVAPSQQSVQDALAQLGAGPSDRVLFIGHSQGALVAGNIAQQPQPYEIKGLISFGGPISHLDLKVPTIAISHQSDPVSVLGGGVNPMRENWVTVSGDGKFESLVDAHRMAAYERTAAELDTTKDVGFRRIQEKLGQDPGIQGLRYSFEISRG
jgi:hypothetical protein